MDGAMLTTSMRPCYEDGEMELFLRDHVRLLEDGSGTVSADGTRPVYVAYLSTRRIVLVPRDAALEAARALPHCRVLALEPHAAQAPSRLGRRSHCVRVRQSPSDAPIVLECGSAADRDALLDAWRAAVASAAVAAEQAAVPARSSSVAADKGASSGVAGLLRERSARREQRESTLEQAFRDLGSLMAHARELVALAERMRAANTEFRDQAQTDLFEGYLLEMGLHTPITRHSAGALFFSELARQMCDLLLGPVLHSGGSMLLTDAFCLINRARATELLAPADLARCCEQLDILALPLTLHTFPSGVKVLRLRDRDAAATAAEIRATCEQRGSLGALELSRLRRAPLLLAEELLLDAEQRGLLCRDGTLQGLVFYPNRFLSWPGKV